MNEVFNFFLLLFRIYNRGRNLSFTFEARPGIVERESVPIIGSEFGIYRPMVVDTTVRKWRQTFICSDKGIQSVGNPVAAIRIYQVA